jgi:hypothetical protein
MAPVGGCSSVGYLFMATAPAGPVNSRLSNSWSGVSNVRGCRSKLTQGSEGELESETSGTGRTI